ncbi:MAG: DUF4290 domain-containing protein [Porphyromonas sp.]|nr:DUF4290 domain-containing protein [Porphyromonas sp.]
MKNSYNTGSKPLILPEYGRHVQNMVNYCLTIEDRAERQHCAESIIETMKMVSPRDKDREDHLQVLWDHLYIMSDFALDVDFPFEVTPREAYESPIKCALDNDHQHKPAYRHYGRIIERMIAAVKALPEGEERDALARETALQMKRSYVLWNKETVANTKIFADLYELSEGQIYLDEMSCQLRDAKELTAASAQTGTGSNAKRNKVNNRRKRK